MPNKCVVGGCSNAPDLPSGIGLRTIPFFGDERHEAKKRRKKWVDFVKAKRAKWGFWCGPWTNYVICSLGGTGDECEITHKLRHKL